MTDYTKKLHQMGIDYKVIPLPEDLPLDVASHIKFHGITMQDAIPTLIYHTENGLIAVQKRADTKIDVAKLKSLVGVSVADMATVEELHSLSMQSGVVSLVGLPIPYFVDKKVLERKEIYGGSGVKEFALKIHSRDLVKANDAIVGEFTLADNTYKKGRRVYSGMRATGTGRLHLGNYLGGAKGMLALQNEYDCVFSVVDSHAITTPYDAATLKDIRRNVILDYLAIGLDPEKCKIEIQSQIPEHTELAYLLSSVYPLSQLEDLPTFKEKKAQYPKNVTAALLFYPILMAADVLLYKGELVPVGIDQEPHLEVMREIARRFNVTYGETFPEPHRFKTIGEYVPSLTGVGKMSKTVEGSGINLADSFEEIKKKLAKVPTDSGTIGGEVPKTGGVATLFSLMALFNHGDMHKKFKHDYENGNIRYGDMKIFIAQAIFEELHPIQEKRKYFEENPEVVNVILENSRIQCDVIAKATLVEVKKKMGFI